MRPLDEFAAEARRRIRVVLADIDDTMTVDGRLPSSTLASLEALKDAGFLILPVTGRPAGWCDHIARMWPVDGVIGENGALYLAYDRERRRMKSGFAKAAEERARDRARLEGLRATILQAVPGAGIASDQDYRIADLAIDFCEDVEPLDKKAIARIVQLFEDAGATAKVSSIHVNGWFGAYDKLTMTRRALAELFAIDMDARRDEIVFVGDSPNDQPMFAFFAMSVGVANVRDFELASPPAFVTASPSAAGFAELASALLAARSGGS